MIIKHYFITLLIILLILFSAGCASQEQADLSKIRNINSAVGVNLVCFGNSLTEGQGASKGKDYPSILRAKLDIPIINAGRSGDTTDKALARLDKILELEQRYERM